MEAQVILLDTHALLWLVGDPKRLSKRARETIHEAREESGVAIAIATIGKLAWVAPRGRITVVGSVESLGRKTVARVIHRPVTQEIAAESVPATRAVS